MSGKNFTVAENFKSDDLLREISLEEAEHVAGAAVTRVRFYRNGNIKRLVIKT